MRQINEFNFVQSGPRPRTFCKIDKTREQSWTLNYFCNDLLIMTILWLGSYAIISPFIDRPLFIFTKTREPTTYFRLSKAKLAIASTKGSLLVAGELATEGIFPLILFLGGVRFLLRNKKMSNRQNQNKPLPFDEKNSPMFSAKFFFSSNRNVKKNLLVFWGRLGIRSWSVWWRGRISAVFLVPIVKSTAHFTLKKSWIVCV